MAVLGDANADVVRVGPVVVRADGVQQDHDVGVLLDGPGLAQVGQGRLVREDLRDRVGGELVERVPAATA